MVVSRSADTLLARFGGSSCWFSDARIVNGLIAPQPEPFVR
jgi:hypothetical protein